MGRQQLIAAGIGDGAITRMLARGALHSCHAGVYAVGHPGAVELGDETAALLACSANAVLSHWTALAMWNLLPMRRQHTVHVTIPGQGHRHQTGITVHRTTRLTRKDVRTCHGLPVTSPARTLLDLAPHLTNRQLERALDEALATNATRRNQVAETVARMPGRAGARRLEALLDPGRPRSRTWNDGEERLLRLMRLVREAGVPEPEANYRWRDFMFDLYWREFRLALELDSYAYHSTRSAFNRDRRKEAACDAAGIELLRASYEQLDEEPFALIARIVRKIEAARARARARSRT